MGNSPPFCRRLYSIGYVTILGPSNFEYGVLIAGATLASLPLIVVFLVFQRQFIEAVSSGAFKGE